MAAITGVQQLGVYTNAVALGSVLTIAQANIDALIALIPDPDTAPAQGGGGFLDEMSPGVAAQLRVELAAVRAKMA